MPVRIHLVPGGLILAGVALWAVLQLSLLRLAREDGFYNQVAELKHLDIAFPATVMSSPDAATIATCCHSLLLSPSRSLCFIIATIPDNAPGHLHGDGCRLPSCRLCSLVSGHGVNSTRFLGPVLFPPGPFQCRSRRSEVAIQSAARLFQPWAKRRH